MLLALLCLRYFIYGQIRGKIPRFLHTTAVICVQSLQVYTNNHHLKVIVVEGIDTSIRNYSVNFKILQVLNIIQIVGKEVVKRMINAQFC